MRIGICKRCKFAITSTKSQCQTCGSTEKIDFRVPETSKVNRLRFTFTDMLALTFANASQKLHFELKDYWKKFKGAGRRFLAPNLKQSINHRKTRTGDIHH